MHLELEEEVGEVRWKRKSASIQHWGFRPTLERLPPIIGKDDVLISDKKVHASIIDAGAMAKGQRGAKPRYFKHNDLPGLESILQYYPSEKGKLVVVDGVYSMGGDIAPLPEIARLCKEYNARLMVDDAHAIGVIGNGRGTAAHHDCVDDVDLNHGDIQ